MRDRELLDAFKDLMAEFDPSDRDVESLLNEFGFDGLEIEKEATVIIEELRARHVAMKRSRRTRILWTIKQLFPLSYKSNFIENEQRVRCVWRMWLGRCFNIRSWVLAGE